MINYQIVNGNYTFKNKLGKRSVENIILTGLSTAANRIFEYETKGYMKRSTFALYSMCKHHIPRLTTKTFEKVLSDLVKSKKLWCVYCPDAKKYVYCSAEQFDYEGYKQFNNTGYLINRWTFDDSRHTKLDNIVEEDIERLVS